MWRNAQLQMAPTFKLIHLGKQPLPKKTLKIALYIIATQPPKWMPCVSRTPNIMLLYDLSCGCISMWMLQTDVL